MAPPTPSLFTVDAALAQAYNLSELSEACGVALVAPSKRGRIELAMAAASSAESRAAAILDLESNVYAASSAGAQDSCWRTWERLAACWRLPPLPVTAELRVDLAVELVGLLEDDGSFVAPLH